MLRENFLKDNVAFHFSLERFNEREMCWNQVIRIPFGPSPPFKIYLKILDFTDNFLSLQYQGKNRIWCFQMNIYNQKVNMIYNHKGVVKKC